MDLAHSGNVEKHKLTEPLRTVRESSGGPFPFTPIINSISYPIPSQETGKALVISLRLPESMGGVDESFKSDKVAGLSSVQSWKLVMTATLTLRSKVYAKRPSVSLSTPKIYIHLVGVHFIFGCEIKSLEKVSSTALPRLGGALVKAYQQLSGYGTPFRAYRRQRQDGDTASGPPETPPRRTSSVVRFAGNSDT
ncbi:hypothetical protein EVAR_98505_1 [Eumeta japonica]|uniref:Uncharacterized protein n=1 Tax=Eumeta variegata TaxID=151549 RepID=A0A4C2A9N1_EUMVA|nr:hypothetical protein EVAR_98505_1 [Eumeta japonica]